MILAAKVKRIFVEEASSEDIDLLYQNDWEYVDTNISGQEIWEKQVDYNIGDRVPVVVEEEP